MADWVYKAHRDEGGWGVAPQAPNFTVQNGNGNAVLSWNVPEYTTVDGQVICTAAGIRIMRSTDGYPKDENSGTRVLDTTGLSGTYTDSDLTNGTTYYYRAFPYSDHGVFNRDKYKSKGSATPSTAAKIRVIYTASEAIGNTITAVKGSTSVSAEIKSGTINVTTTVKTENPDGTTTETTETTSKEVGVAFFEVSETGDWTVGGQTVTVSELGASVALEEKMYGYDWDIDESDPESAITYPSGVDNSAFANVGKCGSDAEISLGDWQEFHDWLGVRPVMLNFDGTVAAELNHSDQTKNLDGTTSSVADATTTQNAMVEFPKRYMKRYTDSSGVAHFRISRLKLGEDWKCYPWLYGDTESAAVENDVIYMPMFEGSNNSSKLRSLSGKTPINRQVGATEYSYITAMGDGWQFDDWSDAAMITDFMFMMAKSTDVQSHWGNGHNSGGSQASNLHTTGSLVSHGPFYGGTGNTNMKFMWMENWYGDRWERTFGVWYISNILYIKNFPPYTTDGTVTNYTNLNRGIGGTSGGYISAVSYDENGMIPKTISGSSTTYVPDGAGFAPGTMFLLRGGDCSSGLKIGTAVDMSNAFSSSSWNIGASPAFKKTHAA